MSQTSYSINHSAAYEGTRASSASYHAVAGLNKTGAEIPYGRFVALDTTSARINALGVNDYSPAKLPSAATDRILGACLHDHAHNPANTNGVIDGDMFSIMDQGDIYARTEQAVDPNDPVYVRFTANGTGKDPGQVRKDPDGVAEVHTVTPTAVNSMNYSIRVEVPTNNGQTLKVFTFSTLSDSSATATEICNALRTLMAADAEFTALVVGSGTATLVLTGQVAGVAFTVKSVGDGALADVVTTPAAAKAVFFPGARFKGKGTANNPIAVEIVRVQ